MVSGRLTTQNPPEATPCEFESRVGHKHLASSGARATPPILPDLCATDIVESFDPLQLPLGLGFSSPHAVAGPAPIADVLGKHVLAAVVPDHPVRAR